MQYGCAVEILGLLFSFAVVSEARAHTPNVLPIKIAREYGYQDSWGQNNTPYVSVTLCEPGTKNCETIDNVLLDTGSIGLRIFPSAIKKLHLETELSPSGDSLGECINFAGFQSYWGPVEIADVLLGKDQASRIPVQVIDSTFPGVPKTCTQLAENPYQTASNGILGIRPFVTDCNGKNNCAGGDMSYFSCKSSNCTDISANIPVNLQLPNPVAALAKDNDGFSISLPSVPDTGAKELEGRMILGNESGDSSGLIMLDTDSQGYAKIQINGKPYSGLIDSGTTTWVLPSDSTYPMCSGNLSSSLCPATPMTLAIEMLGTNGSTIASVSAKIGNTQTLSATDNYVFDNLADSFNVFSQTAVLGIPFFLGRTIYFGIDGKNSSMGSGPYFAYKNYENP
jgi:Protein of unknown function (DUF3443)